MLLEAIHWTEIAGLIAEALLLARLLFLKLHRIYAFVTLYWAVSIIFDSTYWFFGWDSKESAQIGAHAPLLLAVLYPLLVWDVFEEVRPKLRLVLRFQTVRMISGLVVTVIMSAIWSMLFIDALEKTPGGPWVQFGLFLWLGSTSVSALFLFTLHKAIKSMSLRLPRNTSVWFTFSVIVLAVDLLTVATSFLNENAYHVIEFTLQLVSVAVTIWCGVRIRAVPPAVPSEAVESS
jgi:hypothetical protein